MSLVVIVLRDAEDGTVDMSVDLEPGIPTDLDEMTEAQMTAVLMLSAVATPADIRTPSRGDDSDDG